MKSFFQLGFAAFLLLASFAVHAQQCTNFQFWVVNQAGENYPVLSVNYLISNANGMPTANGTWDVGANGVQAEFCLSPGCYSIAISGDGVNGESVGLELFQSDFVQILELTPAEGEGIWDAAFCIEQAQEFNCPEAIDYAAGEGCAWAFEIGSFQEGEEVMWNFGDGTEPVWGGHFIEHEFPGSGTYEINAFFTSFDCPMGEELQTVVEVSGCGGDTECELEMEVYTADGMWYTFSIPENLANADIQWYIDGQAIEGANGVVFQMGFDFNPNWSVCVDVVTDACPDGMEACHSNLQSNCPDDGISVDSEGCFYVFSIGNGALAEVQWSIDGEFIEWSGGAFDWTFETGGWHVVTAVYYSSTCPGETYVIEVNTEGCGEGDPCPLDLVWNEVECNQFFIEALNQPEGATLFWTLDGEPYEYGFAEMIYTFEEDGCHVFGVGYETPECPQGAFAEVEICSDCTGMDCGVYLDYTELSDGIYLFSAVTVTGELFGGEVNWWTGGENVGSGNPFAWTWDVEEPMNVGMCIGYGSWQDCPGGETCVELETPGMACEEVQLVLNGSWTAEVDWTFEVGLEAFIDGWEIAGWSFEEAWSAEGAVSDTLTLCVPPACFDVFWGWDAASVDVEALLVSVLIAGMDPVALFDWFEPFNNDGFGLLPDCVDAVSTPELESAAMAFWPNPAQSHIQWRLPSGSSMGWFEVFDTGGRLVHRERVQSASGSWETSAWPVGIYNAVWTGEGRAPIRAKFLVLR